MQLTFRTSPGGPVLASVTAGYEGCQFVWVTVGAQTQSPLDGYTSSELPIQQRVPTIAGIGWLICRVSRAPAAKHHRLACLRPPVRS
jgi:hypothetical protein